MIAKYAKWLHTQWPAGKVEPLPEIGENGTTNVSGIRVVGDLSGIPLLKFSSDGGTLAVRALLSEASYTPSRDAKDAVLDLAIIGGGVSGVAAAIEASKHDLNYKLFEASEAFSTIRHFPRKKPIYTYPLDMKPAGGLQFSAAVKEGLLEELEEQRKGAGVEPVPTRIEQVVKTGEVCECKPGKGEAIRARRVIIAIGRSGQYCKLGVPGEELDKVMNRLHDPADYAGKEVLVVGGGDSALESANALAASGARVSLSYRKNTFSRPKPDNLEHIKTAEAHGKLRIYMGSQVQSIKDHEVLIQDKDSTDITLKNDFVFSMIGREAPLGFFRRSGIRISGEWRRASYLSLMLFFAFTTLLIYWKSSLNLFGWDLNAHKPEPIAAWFASIFGLFKESMHTKGHFLHVLYGAMKEPSFYYSLAYCTCVVAFGIRRVKRRRTPYVKLQTSTLAAFQVIPLFLLPFIILPWMGENAWFESGFGGWIADAFWPNGEYWRAFGLVLAWPLFIYNWFTEQPMWGWLILGFIQTFVLIPWMVHRWGKGAYCGWICSCGALAETLGDAHRHKMPHGPFWNKLNMLGQVILGIALILFAMRIISWVYPEGPIGHWFHAALYGNGFLNYKYIVDVWLAGVLGIAFYFHFSGRVWCRFACPLAALMHIYARFSKFRIFADKKKCISCNVCTSVCHQGIDIMNFANKGLPMEDPQCVRCSACVQLCPTGVLQFGRYGKQNKIIYDSLSASTLQAESEYASKSLAQIGSH